MATYRMLHILLLVATFAPAFPQALSQAGPAPFAQLRTAWVADLEGHKLKESLSHYTANATFINPDGTHADGIRGIRALYESIFAQFAAKIVLTSRASSTSGDLAYDSGAYTETIINAKTQNIQKIHGDYLTIYNRDPNGQWRIIQQVWTGAPPAQ